ncbi:MAG: CHAT domain-containing protein [Phycisphaerales bacterium]|nr:CHAT domain-containing protein [Phycisphaerales bacterium]
MTDLQSDNLADVLRSATDEQWLDVCERARQLAIADLGQALQVTERLEQLGREHANPCVRALVLRTRAHALAYANRLDEAHQLLELALPCAQSCGDSATIGHVQMTRLHVLNRQGHSQAAAEAGRDAADRYRTAGEPVHAARAAVNLGVVHRTLGNPAEAIELFNQARSVLGNDARIDAQILSNLAEAYLETNRFAEAENAFAQARDRFAELNMARATAIVEGNLADLLGRQGRFSEAFEHFERARRSMPPDEAPGDLARLLAEEAEAMCLAGQWADAAPLLVESLRLLDQWELTHEAARSQLTLAMAYHRCGKREPAGQALVQARRRIALLNDQRQLANLEQATAALAIADADLPRAEAALERALKALEDRPSELQRVQVALAWLAMDQGDLERADALLSKLSSAPEAEFALAPMQIDLNHARGRLAAARGQLQQAIDFLEQAADAIERIRGSLQAERMRSAFLGGHARLFDDLLGVLLSHNDAASVAQAFRVCEQARSRSLVDAVASLGRQPQTEHDDASDVALVMAHRSKLNALYSRALDLPKVPPTLAREIHSAEQALHEAERRLQVQGGLATVLAPSASADQVRRSLPPDCALLEYVFHEDVLHCFVLDARGKLHVCKSIAEGSAVCDAVDDWAFQATRSMTYDNAALLQTAPDAERTLQRLFDLLVRPLANVLADASALHIVPHDLLHAVPFAALHDGTSFLVERLRLSQTPSATLLTQTPASRMPDLARARALALGFADAAAPAIEAELADFARMCPHAQVSSGAEATVESLLANATGAQLLHLAAHGRFLHASPLGSGMRLADRWLTSRDLLDLRLDHALVTLSGCDTGRAAIDACDELQGLVRTMFAAGASALLMALWPVHDEITRTFMGHFYSSPPGTPVDQAWRAATLVAKATCEHPARWAPFALLTTPS